MLTYSNKNALASFKEVSRQCKGYIKIYNSDESAVSRTLLPNETLASFKIEESIPQGKFFGFAVTRKLTIELIEKLDLPKGTVLKPYLTNVKEEGLVTSESLRAQLPFFYVDTVEINDTKNSTVITAYDGMHLATQKTISEADISYPITLSGFAAIAAAALGYTTITNFGTNDITLYAETVNLTGSELISDVLMAIGEITGTFCFCSTTYSSNKVIKFVNLKTSNSDSITKDSYFEVSLQEPIELTQVASSTQLGDNYSTGAEGYCQVVWDNPFLTLRDDIPALVDAIGAKVIGTKIYPYEFSSRGNPYYEPGDRLEVEMKDDTTSYIYHFNETLEYGGGLRSKTSWTPSKEEKVESAPTNLGESLKQTFAKVDKINKQIDLIAAEASENTEAIAALKINTESISASVTKMEQGTTEAVDSIHTDIETLTKKVEATMTKEDVVLEIKTELNNGVNKVTTSTGFTFNEEGLTIAKSGSEMKTNINEDGMSVYRDNQEVLTADNKGVTAYNLHARTYLIVGENSRFEDFTSTSGEARTGCFWIGG